MQSNHNFSIYFRHPIGVVHNSGVIRRFQIVQNARDHAVLALETEPTAAESAVGASIGDIRRDLMTVFGPGMNLEINRIDRIPESATENSLLASIKPPSPPFNEFFLTLSGSQIVKMVSAEGIEPSTY